VTRPQWLRRVVCFFREHDERVPDAEHSWRYCARCGATLSSPWAAAEKPTDERDV